MIGVMFCCVVYLTWYNFEIDILSASLLSLVLKMKLQNFIYDLENSRATNISHDKCSGEKRDTDQV